MSDEVKLRDGLAVPFVITESLVHRPKRVQRRKKWRGVRAGLTKLIYGIGVWAVDRLEEAFFDDVIEVIDDGVKFETHYAIVIGHDGYERKLQAIQVEHKPPCVHHYEIIRYAEDERQKSDYVGEEHASSETDYVARHLRQDQNEVLDRIRNALNGEEDHALNGEHIPEIDQESLMAVIQSIREEGEE